MTAASFRHASEVSSMPMTPQARFSGRVAALASVALSIARLAAAEMCFDVNLRFSDRAPSRALVESMTREASAIWQRYDVRIQWSTEGQSLAPNSAWCAARHGSFEAFIVRRWAHATSGNAVLGTTWLKSVAIDRAPVYIDQSATERVLDSLATADLYHLVSHQFIAPSDVGRALGRVLAHEIGHVILAVRCHGTRGLMRPVFLANDLVTHNRQSYSLSDGELTRLRGRELTLKAQLSPGETASLQRTDQVSRLVGSTKTRSP
jgi:hypothetical protein